MARLIPIRRDNTALRRVVPPHKVPAAPEPGQVVDPNQAFTVHPVSAGAILACDPAMCAVLAQHGVAAGNPQMLRSGARDPLGSDVVLATAARETFGTRLVSVYAPELLRSFGTGATRVGVRIWGLPLDRTVRRARPARPAPGQSIGRTKPSPLVYCIPTDLNAVGQLRYGAALEDPEVVAAIVAVTPPGSPRRTTSTPCRSTRTAARCSASPRMLPTRCRIRFSSPPPSSAACATLASCGPGSTRSRATNAFVGCGPASPSPPSRRPRTCSPRPPRSASPPNGPNCRHWSGPR